MTTPTNNKRMASRSTRFATRKNTRTATTAMIAEVIVKSMKFNSVGGEQWAVGSCAARTFPF
jgi:hypothetical protein